MSSLVTGRMLLQHSQEKADFYFSVSVKKMGLGVSSLRNFYKEYTCGECQAPPALRSYGACTLLLFKDRFHGSVSRLLAVNISL